MLVGIVKKNAIMMIDFALEAERAGATPADAIYKGCLLRFRPIMMTTMAALLRHPADRARHRRRRGRPARRSAWPSWAASWSSQLLTLYITPVLYIYMSGAQTALSGLRGRLAPRRAAPAARERRASDATMGAIRAAPG